MKELINYRYYVISLLVNIAFGLTLSDWDVPEFDKWITYHITTKAIAAVLFFCTYKLMKRWEGKLPLFGKIQELTTSIIEK